MTRVLVFGTRYPDPPAGGSDLRNSANLKMIQSVAETAYFALFPSPLADAPAPGPAWFASAPPAAAFDATPQTALAWLSRPDGHPGDAVFDEGVQAELLELAARFRPEVVVVQQIWLASYLPALRAAGYPVALPRLREHHAFDGPSYARSSTTGHGPQRRVEASSLTRGRVGRPIVR